MYYQDSSDRVPRNNLSGLNVHRVKYDRGSLLSNPMTSIDNLDARSYDREGMDYYQSVLNEKESTQKRMEETGKGYFVDTHKRGGHKVIVDMLNNVWNGTHHDTLWDAIRNRGSTKFSIESPQEDDLLGEGIPVGEYLSDECISSDLV